MSIFNNVGKIKDFCCEKILPLVYDESLSYYEVLCKLTSKCNQIIDEFNKVINYSDKTLEKATEQADIATEKAYSANVSANIATNMANSSTESATSASNSKTSASNSESKAKTYYDGTKALAESVAGSVGIVDNQITLTTTWSSKKIDEEKNELKVDLDNRIEKNVIELYPKLEFGSFNSSGDIDSQSHLRSKVINRHGILTFYKIPDHIITAVFYHNGVIVAQSDSLGPSSSDDSLTITVYTDSVRFRISKSDYTAITDIPTLHVKFEDISTDAQLDYINAFWSSTEQSANNRLLSKFIEIPKNVTSISLKTTSEIGLVYYKCDYYKHTYENSSNIYNANEIIPVDNNMKYLRLQVRLLSNYDIYPNINSVSLKFNYAENTRYRITDSKLLTDNDDKLAHVNNFVIDGGNIYGVYYHSKTNAVENAYNTSIYITLYKKNILDLTGTQVDVIKCGESKGGFTQSSTVAPYEPNVYVDDNNVYVFALVSESDYNNYHYGVFKYDKELNFISYDDCLLDNSKFRNCLGGRFIKYDDTFYQYLTYEELGSCGKLIKSNDLIHWTTVGSPNGISNYLPIEGVMDILNTNMYIFIRLQDGTGDGGIYYCVFDISNSNFSELTKIDGSSPSKPYCCTYRHSIIVAYNTPEKWNYDGGEYSRHVMKIGELIPETMEINEKLEIRRNNGIQYPCMMNHGDNIYISYSEDVKKFSPTLPESNIGLSQIIIER